MAEHSGEQFGPYLLEEVIGRGGMGVVYRAYDTRRDRVVALKRLPRELAEDEHFQARFRRESRLAARLNEPHIIPIHDFGEHDGQLFLDMRLVEGLDLGKLIAEEGGRLDVDLAVDLIVQVSAALSAAHQAGLMHRDIKPSNVLISGVTAADRTSPFAYLVDFGIARAIGNEGTALTSTTDWFGTVAYMAPERISGSSGDARSDIYSLACLLFQCLTGQAPYTGEALQVLFAHVNNAPPSATERAPGVPPGLDAAVRRGMAKKPHDRFQTVGEFAAAVKAATRGGGVRRDGPVGPAAGFGPVPLVKAEPGSSAAHAVRAAGAAGYAGPQAPSGVQGPSFPPRSGPPHSFPPAAAGHRAPYAGPSTSQPPYAGPSTSQPPYAGPSNSQPPYAGPSNSQPPYAGPSTSQPPYAGPSTSQPPYAGPSTSQPPRSGGPHRDASPPAGSPRSGPPHSGPPHSGPHHSVPPRPAPPTDNRALIVMIAVTVAVVIAAIIAVVVATSGNGDPDAARSATAVTHDDLATVQRPAVVAAQPVRGVRSSAVAIGTPGR